MATTPILTLPEIAQSQLVPHVSYNSAIRSIEVLLSGAVLDRTLTVPPVLTSPGDDGKAYIPAAVATGAWIGLEDQVVYFSSDTWVALPNVTGQQIYSIPDSAYIFWDGAAWQVISTGSGESNTASNLGGGEGVFESKSGVDLRFKSLIGGNSITLSSTATEIMLDSDGLLKVTNADTTFDFLGTKLVSGANITLTVLNPGANETLEIAATGGGSDELTKVSSNDTTADYLLNKIVAGTNITINELNDGSNETLEIVASGGGGTDQIKVTANDTTADYLLAKLEAGGNINLEEINDGANETVKITSTNYVLGNIINQASNWVYEVTNGSTIIQWVSRTGTDGLETGVLEIGYITLQKALYLSITGGGSNGGMSLTVALVRQSDDAVLDTFDWDSLLGVDSDDPVLVTIDTATHENTLVYLRLDDSASGATFNWMGISPIVFMGNTSPLLLQLFLDAEDPNETSITDKGPNTIAITNNNTVTLSTITFQNGAKAFEFSGSNQSLSMPFNNLQPGSQPFRLEAWVYITGTGTQAIIAQTISGTTTNLGYYLRYEHSATRLTFGYSTSGTNFPSLRFNSGDLRNAWHFIEVIKTSSTADLDILVDSSSIPFQSGANGGVRNFTSIFASTRDVRIGNEESNSWDFQGFIDDVKIFIGT